MERIRFRLRTLMIIIAFVAFGVVLVMQRMHLARSQAQMELFRAEAEQSRVVAEMMRVRAMQQLEDLEVERDATKAAGEQEVTNAEPQVKAEEKPSGKSVQ